MNKLREFFNKPATFGILTKFMICLNAVAIGVCFTISYVGLIKTEEDLEYEAFLKHRIEVQEQIIDLLYNYTFGTKVYK